jgi:DNA-binding MarR family transcriptional regulator
VLGAGAVPPRQEWPDPAPQTQAGRLLTDVVLATFRLNSTLLDVAQDLAAAGGVTAAWWQVLGGVLDEPRSVAEIARRMGMTRQGVRRVADLLVERGLAEFRGTPVHRRVRLLACTEVGYWAVRQVTLEQHPWAARIGAQVGAEDLRAVLATMRRLVEALESDRPDGGSEKRPQDDDTESANRPGP